VLVKTLCCGICGSDLHAAKLTRQFVDRVRRSGGRLVMDSDRDVVFGHEFCCEIVEYGPGTDKHLKRGTLVCSMPLTVAGTEVRASAIPTTSPGVSRSTCHWPNVFCSLSPTACPPHAALTEPIAVGWHGVQFARLDKHDVPLVVGCGPRGPRGHRRAEHQGRAPDHRGGFLTGAAGVGSEDGRGHRHRFGGGLPVQELARLGATQRLARRAPRVRGAGTGGAVGRDGRCLSAQLGGRADEG
jgi:Alcohol dehydrogenase GroES-like domain